MPGISTFLPALATATAPTLSPWHSWRGPTCSRRCTGLHDEALAGSGRLVLVHGEAGVGQVGAGARVGAIAVGPQPGALGSLRPAVLTPPARAARRRRAAARSRRSASCCAPASATACSRRRWRRCEDQGPAVLVIEDLHWADMSTLDLVRFLARRLEGTHAVVVATYRDEHLQPVGPAARDARRHRVAAGRTPARGAAAVARSCRRAGRRAPASTPRPCTARPAATRSSSPRSSPPAATSCPATVQDAVLARVHRLSPQARLALETAAVIGSRVEPALVHAMPDVTRRRGRRVRDARGCCASTRRRTASGTSSSGSRCCPASRPAGSGALHWQVLDRLRVMPMSPRPFARLAEHAEMAGDGPAVLEFAVAAGDAAASLGVAPGGGVPVRPRDAVRRAARRRRPHRAAHQAGRTSARSSDDHEHAIAAWEQALVLLRAAGRDLEVVDALLGLDESYYTIGDNSRGTAFVDEALSCSTAPARAGSWRCAIGRRGAHHLRASRDSRPSLPWFERAIAMGRDGRRPRRGVPRACPTRAAARFLLGEHAAGRELVEEALQVALAHDLEDSARGTTRRWRGLSWLDFDLGRGARTHGGGRALHGRAGPQRAADVRARPARSR